ncbi:MAG: hypothetical protein M3346_02465, partial [Actinomycetota bacterium]|nr:hypothetical protein [Actinomycetota bacterium]
ALMRPKTRRGVAIVPESSCAVMHGQALNFVPDKDSPHRLGSPSTLAYGLYVGFSVTGHSGSCPR